jgi:hypothetical protein
MARRPRRRQVFTAMARYSRAKAGAFAYTWSNRDAHKNIAASAPIFSRFDVDFSHACDDSRKTGDGTS